MPWVLLSLKCNRSSVKLREESNALKRIVKVINGGFKPNMNKFPISVLIVALIFISVAQAEESTGISNKIKWETASELNNFGFDVLRGDGEEGPFTKVNENMIPGAGSIDTPRHYEFIDDTIEAEKVYWYYVESISMSGERQKFTPTFQSRAKSLATDS